MTKNQEIQAETFRPIKELLIAAGADGVSIAEMEEATGVKRATLQDRCRRYLRGGLLTIFGVNKLARYFIDQAAVDEHCKTLDERTAQRKAKAEQRERDRWKARNAARPRKHHPMAHNPRAEQPSRRNTLPKPRQAVEIINPGVEIQRIPCSNDYRFSVSPHFKGEFTREWQEKRA